LSSLHFRLLLFAGAATNWTVTISENVAPQIADLALAVLPAGRHKQHLTAEVLGWRGVWTAEERRRRADNDLGYTLYLGMPYYARWIWAAAKMLVDKKHVSLAELQEKIAEVKSRYEKK
jgi:Nitrile hydratase beta subunit